MKLPSRTIYLALSIIYPPFKLIHTFLFGSIVSWTLVWTELTKNVSGSQKLSVKRPPSVRDWLRPSSNLGSCQKRPRYRSKLNSWKGKEERFYLHRRTWVVKIRALTLIHLLRTTVLKIVTKCDHIQHFIK